MGGGDSDDLVTPARDGARRVLRAAGVKRVVMTSAANAASPSSYTADGVTDETVWTDPDDPTLIPYRKAKTLAERTAWNFMADDHGPMTLTTILPGAVLGPILTTDASGSVEIVARMVPGGCRERLGSAWRSSTSVTWLICTSEPWSPLLPPGSGSSPLATSSGCATWP